MKVQQKMKNVHQARLMSQLRTEQIFQKLQAFVRYQYDANAHTTLGQIHNLEYNSYRVHPDLLTFARDEREGILQILQFEIRNAHLSGQQGLIHLFMKCTKKFVHHNNQFLTISPGEESQLEKIYTEYLAHMADILSQPRSIEEVKQRLQTAVEVHFRALHAFITRLIEFNGCRDESLVLRPVMCEEYPVSLQLSVLGIDERTLVEPILDIGCGERGALVGYLRELGLEALGVDRLTTSSYCLIEANWLEFHFQTSSWGTIISHMAFSNHFIFHHLYRNGAPELYARKYMEMLRSLRVGGEMYYAPGLPFIEKLLPSSGFDVVRKRMLVPKPMEMRTNVMYNTSLGQSILYSTKIMRLV